MEELRKLQTLLGNLGLKEKKAEIAGLVARAEVGLHNLVLAEAPPALGEEEDESNFNAAEKLEEYEKLPIINSKFLSCECPEDGPFQPHRTAPHKSEPCYEIDDFHDVAFLVEGSYIKANRCILAQRCPYLARLLSSGLRECVQPVIYLPDVPKNYFVRVMQFVYTDVVTFETGAKHAEEMFHLLVWADYFLLPRLVDVTS